MPVLICGEVLFFVYLPIPKRLVLSWIPKPRVPDGAGGHEITYGRSLQCHLATSASRRISAFTEWAPLAQDRAGW